jgi:hypothetical protein
MTDNYSWLKNISVYDITWIYGTQADTMTVTILAVNSLNVSAEYAEQYL